MVLHSMSPRYLYDLEHLFNGGESDQAVRKAGGK
jgi:hypothetical protein